MEINQNTRTVINTDGIYAIVNTSRLDAAIKELGKKEIKELATSMEANLTISPDDPPLCAEAVLNSYIRKYELQEWQFKAVIEAMEEYSALNVDRLKDSYESADDE